jgi:hypothetical protein
MLAERAQMSITSAYQKRPVLIAGGALLLSLALEAA